MSLHALGLNHTTAPLQMREKELAATYFAARKPKQIAVANRTLEVGHRSTDT
jgi:glutamyl-tRNA reductase